MKLSSIHKLYRAGRIKRYHSTDVEAQTIGHHSWGVAMIVAMIYPKAEGYAGMSSRLILAALTHDLAEIETGDIPATAKWASPRLCEELSEMEGKFGRTHELPEPMSYKEDAILKWADTFELCLYAQYQINKGNEYAVEILNNGLEHLRKKGFPTTEARELYDQVFGR